MSEIGKKQGCSAMLDILKAAKQNHRIKSDNKWWIDFLFHFTSIRNVKQILEDSVLYSRTHALANGITFEDSASQRMVHRTNRYSSFARLYFRPRTPTTYHMEGFKPCNDSRPFSDAHCPVPVYLLFDIGEIVCCDGSLFSDGHVASPNTGIYSSSKEFTELPFVTIYNDAFPSNKDYKRIRQAEVLVPTSLSLSHLRYIYCRSEAEYDTLRNLCSEDVWNQWKSSVRIDDSQHLFNGERLFVKGVKLDQDQIAVKFNLPCNAEDNGAFRVRIVIYVDSKAPTDSYENSYPDIASEFGNKRLIFTFKQAKPHYIAIIILNDALAYLGIYSRYDDIFN
ncbi:MAG: DarT ssDNA thymidine ADP-ribosyltransferase family protein [Chloroflexota bacterium]|nr:DarT ssDNA thymidine ADP-ribosyltransferase family protein [Chloroflexota bacterium]